MQTKTFSKTKQALNNPNSFQIYAFICIFFSFFTDTSMKVDISPPYFLFVLQAIFYVQVMLEGTSPWQECTLGLQQCQRKAE